MCFATRPRRHKPPTGVITVSVLVVAFIVAVGPACSQPDDRDAGNAWTLLLGDLTERGLQRQVHRINGDQTLAFTGAVSGAATHYQSLNRAFVIRDKFSSELEAVTHAMNNYNPFSVAEDREYIGAIYQLPEGNFIYSVAPGEIGSDLVKARIPKLKGARIIAFWHTHGGAHWSRRFFSDTDTSLVKQYHLDEYRLRSHLV